MLELSIIIVNYNTKDLTLNCIESVRGSNLNKTYEVIIVDNGSTDGFSKAIEEKSAKWDVNLKLIENDKNLGFAKAINQGIKIAKGRYLLLLNSDTKVAKNAILDLINFAEKNPAAAIVGTALVSPDGKIQESVYHFPTIIGAIKEFWFGMKGEYKPYIPKSKDAVEVDSVFATVFLIRKEVVEEIGGFDERFFMYFEDIEFCRRASKRGYKVYYLPKVKVLHYLGASGKNLAKWDLQWRRLIPSSKIYHGEVKHYLIFLILWVEQRIRRMRIAFLKTITKS